MLDKNNIPRHVAIIMDGNGRWAKERGLPRTAGHRQGLERVKEIIRAAAELGIEALTLFAFSAENWARPKSEVKLLMRHLDNFLEVEAERLGKNNIRLKVIGRGDPIAPQLQEKIRRAEATTRNNTRMTLVLALNYGARQEITDAAKGLAQDLLSGKARLDEVDDDFFSRYLYTAGIPDPDLLIRTSGEMRISNFLLWQISYAELYFSRKYWPAFRKKDLEEALEDYQKRQRRFGRVYAGKKNS